jgi:hypothetical protein
MGSGYRHYQGRNRSRKTSHQGDGDDEEDAYHTSFSPVGVGLPEDVIDNPNRGKADPNLD